jgi:peptidoglycan/xylan/chitin deacetylase (PgdA/CDA1 family)
MKRCLWGLILFCFVVFPILALPAQEVALTFDDLPAHGPVPEGLTRVGIIKSILNDLKAAQAPQVYGFINAGKLEQVPADMEVLKLWRAAGFPLGNHTYTHPSLNKISAKEFEQNIEKNEPGLKSLMDGEDWHWLRYPFLDEGDTVEKRREVRAYLKDHGYRIAQVTLDFQDWAWNSPYARCVAKKNDKAIEQLKTMYVNTASEFLDLGPKLANLVYGRDIKHVLLLHVGGFETVMLPRLMELLKQRGYKLITLLEAESDAAYKSDPDIVFTEGGTLLEQMIVAKHLQMPQHAPVPITELEAMCQ